MVRDKDVFENQQKSYNIISLNNSELKQSIKVFPKFRNEIKVDGPTKTRQAFISGRPELVLKKQENQALNP